MILFFHLKNAEAFYSTFFSFLSQSSLKDLSCGEKQFKNKVGEVYMATLKGGGYQTASVLTKGCMVGEIVLL